MVRILSAVSVDRRRSTVCTRAPAAAASLAVATFGVLARFVVSTSHHSPQFALDGLLFAVITCQTHLRQQAVRPRILS
eukprot:3402902-Prymnesium_polylepis.1